MTNTNETTNALMTAEHFNGVNTELMIGKSIAETLGRDEYTTYQKPDGKFARKLVYKDLSTVVPPKTREGMLAMVKLLNGEDETVLEAKPNHGKEFELVNVITKAYEGINPDTGMLEPGVITYLFTADNEIIVSSSKSVYIALRNYMGVFGIPNTPTYQGLKLKLVGKKGYDHTYTTISLLA